MGEEDKAGEQIDILLGKASWQAVDRDQANIHAPHGVAIRELPLKSGHAFADRLLYINSQATSVIEAKKAGSNLSGVEIRFTKVHDPERRARPVWLSQPETSANLIQEAKESAKPTSAINSLRWDLL